jgi:hypothetical protein
MFDYFHETQACFDTLNDFTKEQIAKHKAALQPGQISDYIDAYLLRLEEESEHASSFTGKQSTFSTPSTTSTSRLNQSSESHSI